MASAKKIAEIIAAIKTIYPYYSKDADSVTLAKTWAFLLKDIPDEVTEVAFMQSLKVCKTPPTPADVLEQVRALNMASEPTDEELWAELAKAIHETGRLVYYFRFTAIQSNGKSEGDNARDKVQAIWDGLDEKLKMYVGSKGELMRMAECDEADLSFEKSRFMKSAPIIAKRQEYLQIAELLPGGANNKLLT
ncbi:MAG: hypothetical protein J6S71_00645 [Clostridia bacterium]|nr:hypothetical protein [Clostridia bacterium]